MGASLTRLCASCTTSSPHHSPKCVVHSRACCYPPYSYSTLLLVCLSSTPQLPQPAFLSLFTTSSLSLFQSIHSQLANAALFSPSASSHTIRIFPSSRLLLQSLSLPQHSFVSLSSFSSTAPVPCRAPFLAVRRLPPSSVYSHSTTQASIASATYTHFLPTTRQPSVEFGTTIPAGHCQIATASPPTSSPAFVLVVVPAVSNTVVVAVVATSSVLQRTSCAG